LNLAITCYGSYLHCDFISLLKFIELIQRHLNFPLGPAKYFLWSVLFFHFEVIGINPTWSIVKTKLNFSDLAGFFAIRVSITFECYMAVFEDCCWAVGRVDNSWVNTCAVNWLVLCPINLGNVHFFHDFIVSPLRGWISVLVTDNKFRNPLSRSHSNITRTNKSDRVSMCNWKILPI
jgi:hypothetical protein